MSNRYSSGQELDVYIKFVDPTINSLALQLYPYQSVPAKTQNMAWTDLHPEMPMLGTVVKSSEYGVYVDIGAPVLGFLHRRKMLSNRRQRKLKPWEVCPIGTEQSCYIYKASKSSQRIELTTYPPDRWEGVLDIYEHEVAPGKIDTKEEISEQSSSMPNEVIIDDFRQDSQKHGKKVEQFDIDYDDYDDDYERNDETSEEILSAEEIRQLTGRTDSVLDTATKESKKKTRREGDVAATENDPEPENDEDNKLNELFQLLGEGRSHITLSDILDWDYMRVLMQYNITSRESLKRIFVKSGAIRGRLQESRFSRFVDLFERERDSDNNASTSKEDAIEDNDVSKISNIFNEELQLSNSLAVMNSDEETSNDEQQDNEVIVNERQALAKEFSHIAGAKGYATEDDIMNWEVCMGLLHEHNATAFMLHDLYHGATKASPLRRMYLPEFASFREDLKILLGEDDGDDELLFSPEDYHVLMEEMEKFLSQDFEAEIAKMKMPSMSAYEEENFEDDEVIDFYDDDGEEDDDVTDFPSQKIYEGRETNEIGNKLLSERSQHANQRDISNNKDYSPEASILQEVFDDIAIGKKFIDTKDLLSWGLVPDMLKKGVITKQHLADKVRSFSQDQGLAAEGFDKLVEYLIEVRESLDSYSESSKKDNEDISKAKISPSRIESKLGVKARRS